MENLFDTALRSTKVRNGIYAYQYRNGVINICGTKYVMYSMKEAIKQWRITNKLTK